MPLKTTKRETDSRQLCEPLEKDLFRWSEKAYIVGSLESFLKVYLIFINIILIHYLFWCVSRLAKKQKKLPKVSATEIGTMIQ